MAGGRIPLDRVAGFRWTNRPDNFGLGGRIEWNTKRVLGQSQPTTVLVMVANVRAYEPEEVALTKDDYVIQEFPAATADPTLRHKRRV